MKLYFYVGYVRTGGPECIHQYCDMARTLGYDSYMYYHDAPPDASCLYTEKYVNIRRALSIEDSEENVLFIPEIFTIQDVLSQQKLSRVLVVLMWLSFEFGMHVAKQNMEFRGTHVVHTFQSAHAKNMVRALPGSSHLTQFDLGDYIHESCIFRGWDPSEKQQCIAYNPKKDPITEEFCKKHNIPCKPLHQLSYDGVIDTLQRCQVYVDCGYHPGMDRLPREAACLGCVVITNRMGSANVFEDVPIHQKCDTCDELLFMVAHALNHYEENLKSQDSYRDMIYNQKSRMAKQLTKLLNHLKSLKNSQP